MTYVRQFEFDPESAGADRPRVALGSAIAAALHTHDHTFVSYVRFEPGELPDGDLIGFRGSAPGGDVWTRFSTGSKEKGEPLIFSPPAPGMISADPLPGFVWGLGIGTWDQAAGAYHFYFYNLQSHELEDLGGGETGEGPIWEEEDPELVQFGRFEGKYAAAAIFGKTLTPSEIASLAKAGSVEAWASRGPAALWIFDQKEDSEKITDLTGNGADQGELAKGVFTSYVEIEGGLPQLPLREGEEPEHEILKANVRLVGNVSGKVYAEGAIESTSLYKDPDFYLGYCFLAAPFTPRPGDSHVRPKLDPADTRVILQVAVLSPDTEFAEHWLGSLEQRPKALIELPDPLIIT